MIYVYYRVSSDSQITDSQEREIEKWIVINANGPVKKYTDTYTGTTMSWPQKSSLPIIPTFRKLFIGRPFWVA
jgi:hypothetical protein